MTGGIYFCQVCRGRCCGLCVSQDRKCPNDHSLEETTSKAQIKIRILYEALIALADRQRENNPGIIVRSVEGPMAASESIANQKDLPQSTNEQETRPALHQSEASRGNVNRAHLDTTITFNQVWMHDTHVHAGSVSKVIPSSDEASLSTTRETLLQVQHEDLHPRSSHCTRPPYSNADSLEMVRSRFCSSQARNDRGSAVTLKEAVCDERQSLHSSHPDDSNSTEGSAKSVDISCTEPALLDASRSRHVLETAGHENQRRSNAKNTFHRNEQGWSLTVSPVASASTDETLVMHHHMPFWTRKHETLGRALLSPYTPKELSEVFGELSIGSLADIYKKKACAFCGLLVASIRSTLDVSENFAGGSQHCSGMKLLPNT